MIAFDAAGREVCAASRSSTNTPVQALVTLNDPQFVEAAVHLANLSVESTKEDGVRPTIRWMFRQATSRHPDDFELQCLTTLFEEQLKTFETNPLDASKLLLSGSGLIDISQTSKESIIRLASLAIVAQAVLNLDATQVKR
jgi:hypothetical protein